MTRDWNARSYPLDGVRRYCAPACGYHCTKAAYQQAVKDSRALAKACGPGWIPEVHENLGWHFHATHKGTGASVSKNRGRSYWAQVVVDGSQIHLTRSSPKLAVHALAFMLQQRAEACMTASNTLYGR